MTDACPGPPTAGAAGPETAIDPRLTEVGVRKIDATGSGIRVELTIAQEILSGLAQAAMTLVEHTGAENYVEMQFRHPDKPEMVTLTIQRFLGQTPHQKRQEAEARVATLEARLRDAERDTERLDWLGTPRGDADSTICSPGNHGGAIDNWLLTLDYQRGPSEEWEAPTLRAAIDLARATPRGDAAPREP